MLWKKVAKAQRSNVRIFISSTFRDMAGERDLLARRVFPKLRQFTEAQGMPLSEIDLRWGITSEEAAEGKVIELCLREIDACRPYFFAMLGERYGWIDPQAGERLAESFPHLMPFAGRSVTELEIRHGALGSQPARRDRCFFYLRDPKYLDRLPEGADPQDFANEGPQQRELLDALKREILASGYLVREYGDLNGFHDLIEGDLRNAIAPAVDAAVDDAAAADQLGFVTSLLQGHVEQTSTQSFLEQTRGQRKPIVLVGPPGSGKSASLAHWLEGSSEKRPSRGLLAPLLRSRANAVAPAIVCNFLQVDVDAEDWLPVAQSLLADLKQLLSRTEPIERTPEGVIRQVASWLALAAKERPITVVIDGIERAYPLAGSPVLDWLPTPLPKGVDIILSARTGPLAQALNDRAWPALALSGFVDGEIEAAVQRFLALYGKRLPRGLLEAIARAPQATTPLFARTVADELRQFGSHERLQQFLAEYLACPDVTSLFARLLRRLDQDFRFGDRSTASDALALIAASRGGLAESEILELLGTAGNPMPPRAWAELRLAIHQHLVERRGLIDIGPSALRDALKSLRGAEDVNWRSRRLRIVEAFSAREPTPRIARELPWQLAALEDWDRLASVICKRKFLILCWRHCRRDLTAYWRELERRGYHPASLHGPLLSAPLQDAEAARTLAQLLVDLGHRELARPLAETLAAGETDSRGRLDSLSLLAGILIDLGALEDALTVLARLRSEAKRAKNLAVLSVCLGDLALCARRLGNPGGALAYHAEEEKLCRETKDMIGLGECLGNYAFDLLAAGQPRQALGRWREQEGIARRWNQIAMLATSLEGQARALVALRRGQQALPLLAQAMALHTQLGSAREQRICLLLNAEALASTGDVDGALIQYQKIETTSLTAGDSEGVADARIGIAGLFLANGRAAAARHMAEQAAKAANDLGDAGKRAHLQNAIQAILARTA